MKNKRFSALEKKGILATLTNILIIQDMYDKITSTKTPREETKNIAAKFSCKVYIRLSLLYPIQPRMSSPWSINNIIPKYILFTDYIVQILESNVNFILELWEHTLEYKDFQYSKSKTKYMHCNLEKDILEYNLQVKMGDVTSQVSKFKYLKSIMQNDEEII